MLVEGIGEEEDGLLECLHLGVHLVHLDVRLELGEVVDGALAVGGCDDVGGVSPDVEGNLAPCGLDSSDGVGKGTVLSGKALVRRNRQAQVRMLTISKRTASA